MGTVGPLYCKAEENPPVHLVLSFVVSVALHYPYLVRSQQEGPAASLEQKIDKALEQGASEQATGALDELLARPQIDSDALLHVGIRFAQKGLYAQAASAFERCTRDYPSIFEGHYNLALAELAQKHYARALAAIGQAPHGSEAEAAATLYLRGKIEADQGHTSEAEQDLSSAFEREPGQENYALDLGMVYLRTHAYPKAESVFTRASGLNPSSPYLLLGLALAQFLSGHTAQSVQTSRRLLALEPEFSPARLLLGFALYIDGDLAGAGQATSEGLKLPNPNPYLYYLEAAILLKQHTGEYARILGDLSVAEAHIPDCSLCYVASGKAREEEGDLARALSDFETAVQLGPGLSEGWYHLASACDRLGKKAEAARAREHFHQMKQKEDESEKAVMRGVVLQSFGAEASHAP
jgi:Flp pilus assembly protein TadD